MFTHSNAWFLAIVRGFDSPLLFIELNRMFQSMCSEGHKDTWIFNTKPSICITGKLSQRWITLHDDDDDDGDDDDDDNFNNNNDNAY